MVSEILSRDKYSWRIYFVMHAYPSEHRTTILPVLFSLLVLFSFFLLHTQLLSVDCETPKRLKKRHVGLSQGPLAMACRFLRMDLA